ncbi:hypothetical protein [Frankia sp. Cas3]|uniref:hypothetical protein n=1 Tax=Frankia sp. Cas3 TaxID=3073926 RepID=UPI002AD42CB4|nr:hypothetical protein [Frankia sp. Cas3]
MEEVLDGPAPLMDKTAKQGAEGVHERRCLVAGADSRVVMTGARPRADLVPDGVGFCGYRVRLRDEDAVSLIEVWEVVFPAWVVATESAHPQERTP